MEDVAAAAEGDGQAVLIVRRRVRLVFNGRLVQGVAADRARISADIPAPPEN